MKQDPMVLPWHVLCLPFICRKKTKNKFNQRSEKMQKQNNTVKQDKIIIIIIKQSQGPSVPPQGL